jgi:hypothetical protein
MASIAVTTIARIRASASICVVEMASTSRERRPNPEQITTSIFREKTDVSLLRTASCLYSSQETISWI